MTVEDIAKKFSNEFAMTFFKANNKMIVGTGTINEMPVIYVYLENNKEKDMIPEEFDGLQVITKIIGKIKPL